MKINFYATCIGDALKSHITKQSYLLLETLGCEINFPEKQTCCSLPTLNSGYVTQSLAAIKSVIISLEGNDDPIIAPSASCLYSIKQFSRYLTDEPKWQQRAENVAARLFDLSSFIVNQLAITDMGATLKGKAVYHPSCSLFRKLGVKKEPLLLLQNVNELELLPIANQETCCGFGGTFSVKMSAISGEMVSEKVKHIVDVKPDYVITADAGCLINIAGRLHREKSPIKVLHIADVLMSRERSL